MQLPNLEMPSEHVINKPVPTNHSEDIARLNMMMNTMMKEMNR